MKYDLKRRIGHKDGWCVIEDGELLMPALLPTRAAARALLNQERKRSKLRLIEPAIVRCRLIIAWGKP